MPLLDSLASAFDGDAAQRLLLDAALHDGLPGPRTEAWKYTSLRALERRAFDAPPQAPALDADALAATLVDIPAPRLVFVDGVFSPAASDLAALPEGVALRPLSAVLADEPADARFLQRRFERQDEVFARLNAALAREGAVLRVAEGVVVDRPLHLVFVGVAAGRDVAWHARHLLELHRGARATVVEHHLAHGAHANLGNVLAHVHVAADATLLHARVQAEAPRATLFARTDAVLARAAHYRRVDLELGAALSRHELNVRLEGEGARLHAGGALLGNGRRHVDTRLGIEHVARDTASTLLWRGLGADRARVAFHGGIVIRAGADGSDAALSSKNLLLSEQAELDTQPVLEIHADEVTAAHGATVGQLDPLALFYLRSRGLPLAQARALLTAAFCREALSVLGDHATRAALERALDGALQAVSAA